MSYQATPEERVSLSLQEAMSHPPMEEHLLLPSSGQRHVVACFDLETTGLELVDEIVQIGGSVGQDRVFSKYIVPATRKVHPVAARIIGLQVLDGGKGLLDLRDNTLVNTVDESSGLEEFLLWLEEVRGDADGIILASHGAIFLDIPVLLRALRRNNLTDRFKQEEQPYRPLQTGECQVVIFLDISVLLTALRRNNLTDRFKQEEQPHRPLQTGEWLDISVLLTALRRNNLTDRFKKEEQPHRPLQTGEGQVAIFLDISVLLTALRRNNLTDRFKQIVNGFCDTYAIFQADLNIRNYTLQSIYEKFIGRRPEKHRAQEDARDLHTLLTTYFKTEQLSMELPRLAQATYTVRCMEEYLSWRDSIDPHR
ncbi:unnamed protein product [Timema podura]|uniref:Exuperantia RNAse H-like domain-containing protein n=1 Tax=Timema podura TaxID=61482 RepID=A0ABN7P4Y7_TIMPD|nr:unnamed protein product [Timema podura]